ncbi:3289_t:CDS:2, partial [Racocetra fulgida]
FKEQSLHTLQDYVNVLNLILSINNKTQHLNGHFGSTYQSMELGQDQYDRYGGGYNDFRAAGANTAPGKVL